MSRAFSTKEHRKTVSSHSAAVLVLVLVTLTTGTHFGTPNNNPPASINPKLCSHDQHNMLKVHSNMLR